MSQERTPEEIASGLEMKRRFDRMIRELLELLEERRGRNGLLRFEDVRNGVLDVVNRNRREIARSFRVHVVDQELLQRIVEECPLKAK